MKKDKKWIDYVITCNSKILLVKYFVRAYSYDEALMRFIRKSSSYKMLKKKNVKFSITIKKLK